LYYFISDGTKVARMEKMGGMATTISTMATTGL